MMFPGFIYEYGGECYRARYGHTAMEGYPPDKCPDLYDWIKEGK